MGRSSTKSILFHLLLVPTTCCVVAKSNHSNKNDVQRIDILQKNNIDNKPFSVSLSSRKTSSSDPTTTITEHRNKRKQEEEGGGEGIGNSKKIMQCYEVPQFQALQSAAAHFKSDGKLHLRHLCLDSARCAGLVATHKTGVDRRIILDYSRQQVTGETMELLFDLADKVGLADRRNDMRRGVKINSTENRAVLHHVLRMPRGYDDYGLLARLNNNNSNHRHPPPPHPLRTGNSSGGVANRHATASSTNILAEVHAVRDRIAEYAELVRTGELRGASGRLLKNYVCIGIGGSYLGPEFVAEALRADAAAYKASRGRRLRFLANVDPVDFFMGTHDLDPAETLIIIISKTFTTAETMLNAKTAKRWLLDGLSKRGITDEAKIISSHVIAVSTAVDKAIDFGIDKENVFGFWEWVGGRFSVCSAVGILPLSLQYSYEVMASFLDGAHDIDEHFFDAPLRENLPIILGLLGVWNSTFMGYETRAILPYSQALRRLPAHIQQVDMESNGKRVCIDGTPLPFPSGEINFGEPGTIGQHSFYQLLHQGRVVPADFIGFCESQAPIKLKGEVVSNHDELMSNFFAQPDALAYGKATGDLVAEAVPEELRPHKVFPGNRPSSSMLLTRLDAFAVGQLLAIYEHRTAVQGFVWGINSFDQWGVELGKSLAKQVRTQMDASRNKGTSVQGFNSSTSSLLEAYFSHRK